MHPDLSIEDWRNLTDAINVNTDGRSRSVNLYYNSPWNGVKDTHLSGRKDLKNHFLMIAA